MLDTTVLLGAIPARFCDLDGVEQYFAMARGDDKRVAMQMTKWFNTNYHYIVPELSAGMRFRLNSSKVITEYNEAKALGIKTKINLIGLITYLYLSKSADNSDGFLHIGSVKEIYKELLQEVSTLDDEVVVDFAEPAFVKDLDPAILALIKPLYDELGSVASNIKIVVSTYFEHANEATKVLVNTPIWAIAHDYIYGRNIESLDLIAHSNKILIAGVIDGRNIWRADFESKLDLLNQIVRVVPKDRVIVATSLSLLHVPYSLEYEDTMERDLKSYLSFAKEKLTELDILSKLFVGLDLTAKEKAEVEQSKSINAERKRSAKIHKQSVQDELKNLKKVARSGTFDERIKAQREQFSYDYLTTTTIGSFPQTPALRESRKSYKLNQITKKQYISDMKRYIDECVAFQEEIGLDVLVHGEPERNDMVEYFGELLDGFGFSKNGWVQSYGSRCVKPPVIFADVTREKPMSVDWITYAQSKSQKVVKGMLTGPVTILNWSFVRDDIPRSEAAKQIAFASTKR